MKVKKIDSWQLMQAFDKLGIRFHGTGTIDVSRSGKRVKLYDYYKTNCLTIEQKQELKKQFKGIEFFNTRCQYAPEIKGAMIATPKAARLRELNHK